MCTYGNTTWDLVVWVLGAFLESLVVFKLANGTPLIVFSKAILTLLESKKKKRGGEGHWKKGAGGQGINGSGVNQ